MFSAADELGKGFAVDGSEHVAATVAMDESVEPDVVDAVAEIRVAEKFQHTTDVVLVDVSDDERFELFAWLASAAAFGQSSRH